MLGAVAMTPFAMYFDSPAPMSKTVPVTGRVTCSGRPLPDTILCLDRNGGHSAYAPLEADGKFRILNMNWTEEGATPGKYRAHLFTHSSGPEFPAKYRDPETSGIELDVTTGWNHFDIDLQQSPCEAPR
jgi:hypothetical protein